MSTDSGFAIGSSAPLGSRMLPGGVNFSVYSKNATSMDLLLFDSEDDVKPSRVIALDPRRHRTYHYWHVMVPGLKQGQLYGFRADGEFKPERGLRFDGTRVLLDPYALAVAVPRSYSRKAMVPIPMVIAVPHTAMAIRRITAVMGPIPLTPTIRIRGFAGSCAAISIAALIRPGANAFAY